MNRIEEKERGEPQSSLNIVLLPSDAVKQQVITWSKALSNNFVTEFKLDNESFIPHMSVFSGVYPERNVYKLKQYISDLSAKQNQLTIYLGQFVVMYDTFIFWNANKSVSLGLQVLHEVIAAGVNDLREGLIPEATRSLTSLNAEDQRLIDQYGGVNNGKNYFPHITLTRLKDPRDANQALQYLNSQKIFENKFVADSLAVGRMGEHGTVSRITEVYPFK